MEQTRSERVLYTPSAYARKYLCYAQEVGRLESLVQHTSRREDLSSFLFFRVMKGSGTLEYDRREYALKAGDSVLIDCRVSYAHTSSEEDPWELEWVHFDGKRAEGLFRLFLQENGGNPVCSGTGSINTGIDRLMELKAEDVVLAELEADQLLGALMLELMRKVRVRTAEGDGLKRSDYEKIRAYLNANIAVLSENAEDFDAQFLQGSGYSYAEADNGFTSNYGISIKDYLKNRKLNKAKELLHFSIDPLEKVAHEAGLGSEEEMRALFQTCGELPPEEYRRKWAQWLKG